MQFLRGTIFDRMDRIDGMGLIILIILSILSKPGNSLLTRLDRDA